MKISELIEQLESIKENHGDLEVYKDTNDDELFPSPSYVSITGEVFSKYDFDHFPEDYPEMEEFDLEKDLVCTI